MGGPKLESQLSETQLPKYLQGVAPFGNWTPPQALPLDVEDLDVAPLRELASRAVAMAEAGSAARTPS